YVFPPTSRTRLVSTSYVFGFNNKIAILGFISVLLLLSLFQTDPGLRFLTNLRRDNTRHPNRTLLLIWAGSGLWYLILTVTIYLVVAKPDGFYKLDWESSHFMWHTRMMYLYGLRPYVDFVSNYGPAFAYLPLWSYAALRPFGISLEGSYYVLHYFMNLVGLAALLYFVDSF